MEALNKILSEIGISKVKLAKYLGVSRQMLYNYLAEKDLNKWPKEKLNKMLSLLDIKSVEEIDKINITSDYINQVGKRVETTLSEKNVKVCNVDLKELNKKDQEMIGDIINLLKDKLINDKTKENHNTIKYLYNFLQSIDNTKELKYVLAYFSKSLGFSEALEFAYNEKQQFVFESVMFSAMDLYTSKDLSKNKIAEIHKKFVKEIEHKKEERLSRTQELNAARIQALRELGYTEITADNAKEVLEKIAEIESRKF